MTTPDDRQLEDTYPRWGTISAEEMAEDTLAEHADLLAGAQYGAQKAIADAYRAAVRSGSHDAPGLLAALKVLGLP